MTSFAEPDAVPTRRAEPEVNPIGIALGEWLRELIWTGSNTTARSLQKAIGMSEVGGECEREISYKLSGTPRSNISSDPMASLVGSGIHVMLADMFRRMDAGLGRWLIEKPVMYRGIPGSCDAFDTRRKLLIDWKSTAKAKIRKIRFDGPPKVYHTQANLYAAALKAEGFEVKQSVLVYLARDGELSDLYVCPVTIDQALADEAVDRMEKIRAQSPPDTKPSPSVLCGWCDYHNPRSTDLSISCPGNKS